MEGSKPQPPKDPGLDGAADCGMACDRDSFGSMSFDCNFESLGSMADLPTYASMDRPSFEMDSGLSRLRDAVPDGEDDGCSDIDRALQGQRTSELASQADALGDSLQMQADFPSWASGFGYAGDAEPGGPGFPADAPAEPAEGTDRPPPTHPAEPPCPQLQAVPTVAMATVPCAPPDFLEQCQVKPPTYSEVPRHQLAVPTGAEIYRRILGIRSQVEEQAKMAAGAKQVRGGNQQATRQLEMQLDLMQRDYQMRLEGFLRNYQHTVATTTMLLRQRDGLIGECPASKAKESQALEAKLVGPAQQCRTVIESALRSYAQDTSQLLTKFRDQQKKKEKLPEQAVSILNAWLHEHLCAAPSRFPSQMTTRAVAATTPTPPRPRRTSWLRRRGWR